MSLSLSQLSPSALDHPSPDMLRRLDRLGTVSDQQVFQAMIWLADDSPKTFDAMLDVVEGFPTEEPDGDGEPAPICLICGADVGIFLKFGLDWRHYRGDQFEDLEIFDPGHLPVVSWRVIPPKV
jgi:hypothetical protein